MGLMVEVKSLIIGAVLILKKYTCIDIAIYAESEEDDLKNGIFILPILGFAIGFIACLIGEFKIFYDEFFISVFVLLYYVIITKTTTLKDTYRTLNYIIKPKNNSDQISGIIGVVVVLIFYYTLFRVVPATALIIMPVAGFSGLIILSILFDRNKDGTSIIKYCNKYHIIFSFGISFIIAILFNYKLVVPLALTYMVSSFAVTLIDAKIETLPSSIEGFIIEIVQIIFLIITYLFKI